MNNESKHVVKQGYPERNPIFSMIFRAAEHSSAGSCGARGNSRPGVNIP
ncbi:MAG: hypothetical protein PQ975_03805 [Methanobacterium sp.]